MSWRKHETHAQETKAVRKALQAAGINAKVGHGTGTAWSWLEVNIGAGQQWGEHQASLNGSYGCRLDCLRCINLREMRAQVHRIVSEVTERRGDYNGNMNVLTQDGWNRKRGESVPITHPKWTTVREAALA